MVYKRKEVIGNATLYLGDCLEIICKNKKNNFCLTDKCYSPVACDAFDYCREINLIDAIVTDPPYGIGYDASHEKYKNGVARDKATWDELPFNPDALLNLNKPSIIWGGNCFSSRLPDHPGWLCWVKTKKDGTKIRQAEMELAWTNFINRPQCLRWTWIGAGMEGEGNAVYGGLVHPCQKPVELMKWCIDFLPNAKTILDPYMGSGTTGIACLYANKKFIGIEKEEKYFDIACERIENAQRQTRMFA